MEDLSVTQLRRGLRAASELAELRDLAEFPAVAARLLRELIPCEHAGYNAIDVPSARATVVADPPDAVFEGGAEVLAQFAEQNPLVVRVAAGDRQVLRLSDHISRRELHHTELYDLVYRHSGLEYQLGVRLPPLRAELGRPDEFIGLSLTRTHRDFSDSDRLLLGLLAPLLSATLRRLHELALLRAITADEDTPVVLIDASATIAWASPGAHERLHLTAGDRLPSVLRTWLHRGPDRAAFVLGDHRVRPRLIANAYPELDAIHFRPAAPRYDADELRVLPLTRRQRDVLALILQGLTNRQIAERLLLSPRTVEKHVDNIFARLGVSSRTQAILATVQTLADV